MTLHGGVDLIALAAARGTHHREVVAEDHVELGMGDFARQRRRTSAVGEGEGGLQLRVGVRAVVLQAPAHEVDEALPGAARAHKRLLAGAVLPVDGFVAVGFLDALPLRGNGLHRFLPADALELAFAAAADALHRELQTVGRVDAFAHGAAALAGAQLPGPKRIGLGVVGFDADHLTVLGKAAHRAALSAVDDAGAPLVLAVVFDGGGHGLCDRAQLKAACRNRGKKRPSRDDEVGHRCFS